MSSGIPFQDSVRPWLLACFGEAIAQDREERNHRFLEEALELVQACGCTASEAHQLVDYVFARPVGEKHQEVGGVMVTLAALCLAQRLEMQQAGWDELKRVWTKVDQIRAKQAAKPRHSPLPMHVGRDQMDAADVLEQRLWRVIDRDGLGDVPSDIVGAVARLVTLAAERERLTGTAIADVAAERQRQMDVEGWTLEHDDAHARGEMAAAGACYALMASTGVPSTAAGVPIDWPWDATWWKPAEPRRDLVRAAALLVAEIERLDRAAACRTGG